MRLRYPNNESVIDDSGTLGLELRFVGPLILPSDPLELKDICNKRFVDSGFANLDISKVSSGILLTDRLPEFIGDTTNIQGTNFFTLVPSGVNPGSRVKVTIDVKGRVVGSGELEESDIPALGWNKITRNKPTTLNEYGITDGIRTSGEYVPNGIIVEGLLSNDLHAATKEYSEYVAEIAKTVDIGTTVISTRDAAVGNFLRANGAEVSKTTYAGLYAVIGDYFNPGNQVPGNGKPWKNQYLINSDQYENITGWTTGTDIPILLSRSQAIVTKNRVYLLGGNNNNTTISTIYTSIINTDGTLGAWTASGNLPGILKTSQAIVTKNRVYLLGGYNAATTNIVYTAPINTNGTLGTWTTSTSIPEALYGGQAVVTKNRVYLLGGHNGTAPVSSVYTAPVNADGTIGTWVAGTSLPEAIHASHAVVTKNRVHLLGGNTTVTSSKIYTATINSDGTLGSWSTSSNLPEPVSSPEVIVTKNRVYVLGGFRLETTAAVYSAPINIDGTLGKWTVDNSIPLAIHASQAIVTKNRVYLLGGQNGGTYYSVVCTAPISGGLNDYSPYYDGTIQPLDPSSPNFFLPDYSHLETSTEKYYIKY